MIVLLWFLFVLKHGLLAHVIDFGYSLSRSSTARWWILGLVGNLLVELSFTAIIIFYWFHRPVSSYILLEPLILAASCLYERRATLTQMLRYHVRSELIVLGFYLLFAILYFY